ncbi:maestro heat-like repeat-containing protein family member 1 [Natator depressus]|uniref:maestro heat-like repeat-containing protein family member 1 n=1 Tax=Natator depressus TaxID=27790 RepID=UPI003EBE50E1
MPGPVSVPMAPSAPFLPIRKFKPRLSKEQEAETISPCVASAMIQRPALVKLSGTEVAESSAIRAESLQQLPWDGLDLVLQTFLELHLTPTTLLHLFLHLQPWICSPQAQERSRAMRASARLFMFYRFKAITKDLKPMAEQGYVAGLLKSQAFSVQEATRYWASQAVYWLFMPCKAVVYAQTGVVATMLSKMQKDASCRENPAHVPMLITKHLLSRDLMPFSFTLLEKGECADQLAGVMEAVLRERESELQGQWTRIDVEDGNASRMLRSHSGAEAARACCHKGRYRRDIQGGGVSLGSRIGPLVLRSWIGVVPNLPQLSHSLGEFIHGLCRAM